MVVYFVLLWLVRRYVGGGAPVVVERLWRVKMKVGSVRERRKGMV